MTLRAKRADLRGSVQTVRGIVEPESLGATLMHEHVFCDIRPPTSRVQGDVVANITLDNRFAIDYGEVSEPGNLVLDQAQIAIAGAAQAAQRWRRNSG